MNQNDYSYKEKNIFSSKLTRVIKSSLSPLNGMRGLGWGGYLFI